MWTGRMPVHSVKHLYRVKMKHIKKSVLAVLLTSHVAHASIVVGGTRLVFDGNNDESSINVENKDSKANLVQSWLSVADPRVTNKQAFIITPPLFRLDAGQRTAFGLFALAPLYLQIGSLCTGSILRVFLLLMIMPPRTAWKSPLIPK